MKASVSALAADALRRSTTLRPWRPAPPRPPPRLWAPPPGDLGHSLGAEGVQQGVEHTRHSREAAHPFDQGLATGQGLLAHHRPTLVHHGDERHLPVGILDRLHQMDGKGFPKIVEHIFAGGQVDREVVPFLRRDGGQPPLHDGLIGRDDLDHGGAVPGQITPDGRDQARCLQPGQQVTEETQLGPFKGGMHRGGGLTAARLAVRIVDARGLQGLGEIGVDQLEGVRPGIPDGDVVRGQGMDERLVFDALERQAARHIETQRLELARDQFHGGDAAPLHGIQEVGPGHERGLRTPPEPQARGIGEVFRRGCPRGRDIEDPCARQPVLQGKTGHPLQRGPAHTSTAAAAAGRIGHGMGLVEGDDPVKVRAQPVHDLVQARPPVSARGLAQGRIGGEQNSAIQPDALALPPAGQRQDVRRSAADRAPVAPRILQQRLVA
jgi:hypothetical protein